MPSHADSTASVLKAIRRFRRSRRGSAAVEFAMVAPLFFALLCGIIETAIMFFAGQVLETITQQSARQILTGQAQTAALTQTQFHDFVCTQIPAIFTCANIYVDVESFPTGSSTGFGGITLVSNNDGCNFINAQYSPGGSGDIVVVRLYYQWQLFVTGLGLNLSNQCGGKRLLVSTAAFRNEPFTP